MTTSSKQDGTVLQAASTRRPHKHAAVTVLACGSLLVSLWVFGATKAVDTQQKPSFIPVDVLQLEHRIADGRPIVELKCDRAEMTETGLFKGFSCALRNNSRGNVRAVSITYAVLLGRDADDTASRDSHSLTIETLIHSDLQSTSNPVRPNEEVAIKSGDITYGDIWIQRVQATIDYVEFDDGTSLGPNHYGSRIVADMREGASKYKNWLVQAYNRHGKSLRYLSSQLDAERLPNSTDGLNFKNFDEESGARVYRMKLRKIRNSKGDAELEKILRG